MSATGDNIGMMEGAFFVGRKAILDWINEFLQRNLGRIEETCTGAIACQLCDALYPGKVNMSKVRWDARADFEYVANYKVRYCFLLLPRLQSPIRCNPILVYVPDRFKHSPLCATAVDQNPVSVHVHGLQSQQGSSSPTHSHPYKGLQNA